MQLSIEINFIGIVQSSLKRLEDCPLQEDENGVEVTIGIFDQYLRGIANIKKGDSLLLFTWLHLASREVLECQPRNDSQAPHTGVFSTRSPDRPNPIGIHTVKVVSDPVNGSIIVFPLEVLDKTPVIDIKPIWHTSL